MKGSRSHGHHSLTTTGLGEPGLGVDGAHGRRGVLNHVHRSVPRFGVRSLPQTYARLAAGAAPLHCGVSRIRVRVCICVRVYHTAQV